MWQIEGYKTDIADKRDCDTGHVDNLSVKQGCDVHHVDNFFSRRVTDITKNRRRVALTFQGMYDSITTYKQLNKKS